MLVGVPPNPMDFWPVWPEAPLSAALSLPLLGLIFPPVRQAEQMIHAALDSYQLTHLPLGLPVLGIRFLEM